MRRMLFAACVLTTLAGAAVSAGPILDEILNYMFVDQTTPAHPRSEAFDVGRGINLTKDEPIGQTFVTGPEADRIIRVRTWINPDAEWQAGEGAEMVVWDSPAKKVSLGRYTIWHEYRGFQFSRPEFEVNAKVKPNTTYYMELWTSERATGRYPGSVCATVRTTTRPDRGSWPVRKPTSTCASQRTSRGRWTASAT